MKRVRACITGHGERFHGNYTAQFCLWTHLNDSFIARNLCKLSLAKRSRCTFAITFRAAMVISFGNFFSKQTTSFCEFDTLKYRKSPMFCVLCFVFLFCREISLDSLMSCFALYILNIVLNVCLTETSLVSMTVQFGIGIFQNTPAFGVAIVRSAVK